MWIGPDRPDLRHHLIFQPGRIHHHVPMSGLSQAAQVPSHQGHAAQRQQRLGRDVGQRSHPLAPARGQHQRRCRFLVRFIHAP